MVERLSAHVPIAIVGAGMSGIGAAIGLAEDGFDFVVLEKSDRLGGTWRDNTYPGCACDVPSALYSYSFAPNPGWTRAFAGQAEILAYLHDVAARHRVVERIRFGVSVEAARWDPRARRWHLETSAGSLTADVLVAAAGPWHEPKLPAIEGIASFEGRSFHSSRWDHQRSVRGERVAIVGTGASAVQIVPAIAGEVAHLHVYQRTAQWVLPKPDALVPERGRDVLRRAPLLGRALRRAEYAALEAFGLGFREPRLMTIVERIARAHLERSIEDPDLRRLLTPDYTLGCKRLLMSNSFYPALARAHVSVHAAEVVRVRGRRVLASDGSDVEVDTIVYATGYRILDMPLSERIFDGAGTSLAASWGGSPRAYLGTTIAGFPNLFLLLGPSLGTGHSSAFTILEAQLRYVRDGLRQMRTHRIAVVDARREVMAAYFAEVQEAVARTVYATGGCASYYVDRNGRNTFAWPWSTPALERRLASFDLDAYDVARERSDARTNAIAAEVGP